MWRVTVRACFVGLLARHIEDTCCLAGNVDDHLGRHRLGHEVAETRIVCSNGEKGSRMANSPRLRALGHLVKRTGDREM
jgi:hypothetical protein